MTSFFKSIPQAAALCLALAFFSFQVNTAVASTLSGDGHEHAQEQPVPAGQEEKKGDNTKDAPVKKEKSEKPAQVYSMDETVYPAAILAKDTTAHFIAAYGKDTLMELLNRQIKKSVKYFNFESWMMTDDFQIAQLLLVGKQFNLGFDTLKHPNLKLKSSVVKLYGRRFGKASDFIDTVMARSKSADEVGKLLQEQQENRISRVSVGTLSNYFNVPKQTIDSLYYLGKRLPLTEQVELYYVFSEFAKTNPEKTYMLAEHKPNLLQYLYNTANLPALTGRFVNQHEETNLVVPYSLLAYGLYGKDFSLEKQGDDLMYLLSFQNTDGGWRDRLSVMQKNSHHGASLYALWALCEYRELLKDKK